MADMALSLERDGALAEFLENYVIAILWANCWQEDGPDGVESIDGTTLDDDDKPEVDTDEARAFFEGQYDLMVKVNEAHDWTGWRQHGHDFALTRNGHGAGFWDRGYGEPGERLSKAARPYGEHNVFVETKKED